VKRTSVCALVSGGLDSCALLADLARRYDRVHPVFVRQGLFWEAAELCALRRFLRATKLPDFVILDLPVRDLYGAHWSTTGQAVPGAQTRDDAVYLPGRNLLLLTKAAVFCAQNEIGTMALGSLGHNPFADATPQFFREFAKTAGLALGCRLRVIAPYRKLVKAQVIRRHRELPLHLSLSCIAPQRTVHCGHCNKCAERRQAYHLAGIADRTIYASR